MTFVDKAERRGDLARRVFLLVGLTFVILVVAGFFWATSVPGQSYSGPSSEPEDPQLSQRLEAHVRTLAGSPRNLEQLSTIQRTLAYLDGELRSYGYEPVRQEVVPPADNLIAKIEATAPDAPVLIVGAHYDTAGPSPGADDNASGVAALLEIARSLSHLDGKSTVEIHLVLYANEEPPHFKTGSMGSFVHAQSIQDPDQVEGMISLETMAYFSDERGSQDYPFPLSLRYPDTGNFIAFVGDTSSRSFLRSTIADFRKHARIPSTGGTAPSIVQGIDWSDHWAYSERGIPAFMVTDSAPFRNPNYHRKTDTPDTLDYRRLALVVEGLTATLEKRATDLSPDAAFD